MSSNSHTAACVRACAMRNTMLNTSDWQTLAGMSSSRSIIEWLKSNSIIAEDITDILGAERAVHEAVIHNATGLMRFGGKSINWMLKHFVMYYDLLNMESTARRIHAMPNSGDQPQYRFYNTGPFGLFRPSSLETVTTFPALGHMIKKSLFSSAFNTALAAYTEDNDAAALNERLELAFFRSWISSASSCGIHMHSGIRPSALTVFITAKVIEAAVRLKLYRKEDNNRVAEWLSLAAPPHCVNAGLSRLSGNDEANLVPDLLKILLPAAAKDIPEASGPRNKWGLLDKIVMKSAMRATGGIVFSSDFLASFVLRQMCQARDLTMLLELSDANIDVKPLSQGGLAA